METEHHIWCNWWKENRATCTMCLDLFKRFPYATDQEAIDLAAKHFPECVRLTSVSIEELQAL